MKENENDLTWEDVKKIYNWIRFYLENKIFWLFIELTAYQPFSTLFRNHRMHYSRKDTIIAMRALLENSIFSKIKIEPMGDAEDQYFIYLPFMFYTKSEEKRKKFFNNLARKVGEENYYLREYENGFYQVNFIREKISREMLVFS